MKIKVLAAVLIWVFVFENAGFAQKENYVWYFGDSAGVDFNSGSPVALTNGMLVTDEGCSSMSDANGNLLFYTDGITVWDHNHIQMPNGDSLEGGISSTQSGLIVPFIGNNLLYYVFTVPNNSGDFTYSVIDISLNSGFGDVTIKNNLLVSPVTEKLSAVKHSNSTDIWVMAHEFNGNNFFCYLVTSAGISSTPVVSSIGQILSSTSSFGQMKFSPDGTKLAYAAWSGYVELFDFNSSTGDVTNEKSLSLGGGTPYGIEFSPNGNYLYCTSGYSHSISQWDISSNIASVINSTLLQVGTSSAPALASMQSGPDGKIYVAEHTTNFLGVINYPDSSGLSCNYIDNALSLSGKTCRFGLPNFITSYFLPTGINSNNPKQNQLTISPNPATDKITISFAATTSENITTKIFSITGEVVFEEKNKIATPITTYQIPIFNLSNGIYFLSVQTEREKVTKKIVVNH